MGGVIVEVSARKFSVPFVCVCCSGAPTTEMAASSTRRSGKRVVRETTKSLGFPYCQPCYDHVIKWQAAGGLAYFILALGLIGGIVVGFAAQFAAGLITYVASFPVALIVASRWRHAARAGCGPNCATPDTSVAYLGWSGSVSSFEFRSEKYAARFGAGNARNLINVRPSLRQLIEQESSRPRKSVQASAHTVPSVARSPSAESDVLDWISRIEGIKGPVARRNALERALREIPEGPSRDELLLAASRIEIAAVLDKVDSLVSVAAKRRHLHKAITDVQADNIPDELQAEELRQLEEKLQSVG